MMNQRKGKIDNLNLCRGVRFVGEHEMPALERCDAVPSVLVPFNLAMTIRETEGCVHFFIDDYQFERVWRAPGRYIDCLRRFRCVISPDFSQYIDMPYAQRMWNNYRGKLLGAFLQAQGLTVIPNVTWSTADSYAYCFEGIPVGSVIAINSTGVARHGLSRYLWLKGYREALRRLRPTAIVRYGNVIEGEDEARGVYFYNDRLKYLRSHGS